MAATEIALGNDGIGPHFVFEPCDSYRVPQVGPNTAVKRECIISVLEDVSIASHPEIKEVPGLYITGLGSQYPPFLLYPEKLEGFVKKWYDIDSPG